MAILHNVPLFENFDNMGNGSSPFGRYIKNSARKSSVALFSKRARVRVAWINWGSLLIITARVYKDDFDNLVIICYTQEFQR
jgi:hypothetical protein